MAGGVAFHGNALCSPTRIVTGPGLVDAYSPSEVAARVRDLGVAKVRRDLVGMLTLAVLAGAFIGLGAVLFTVLTTGSTLGFGATRLPGGLGFSLGLISVSFPRPAL